MNKNKFWRKALIGACTCFMTFSIVCFAGGEFRYGKTSAEVSWEGAEIEETYAYRSKFIVPERQITVNGKSEKTQSVTILPDGTATSAKEITLNQSGKYEIRYTAALDGKAYSENYSFLVYPSAYYCSGTGESKVEYKTDFEQKFPYTYWNSDNTTEIRYTDFKKSGLLVELKQGDVFECARLIDMKDLTKKDNLVALTAIPYEIGVCDFERLDFVFTDSEDENISLHIRVRGYLNDGDEFPYSYALAGGQNQALKGYEEGKKLIHVNNDWGTGSNHSFYGTYTCIYGTYKDPDRNQTLKIAYDADENAVYTGEERRVCDLDDPDFFSSAWNGFPSGKAKLTIEAGIYSGETARFLITGIAGLDLSEEIFEENQGPEITTDVEYDVMPLAKKGGTYPIAAATARDEYSGECLVRTSVWYNYGQENAVLVPVSDGRFKTDKTGVYAIVYEAFDSYGNRSAKIHWINCVNNLSGVTAEISSDGYDVSAIAGEYVDVATVETSGGSGDINVVVSASIGEESLEITDGRFCPETTGIYTITYTATDYIGQSTSVSYEISVSASATPLFNETPVLPTAYLEGFTYIVPTLYADDYSSGKREKVLAEARITDATGTRVYRAGESFIPKADAEKSVLKIVFAANGGEKEFEVPLLRTKDEKNLLLVENYFITECAETFKNEQGVLLQLDENSSVGGASFVNSVLAELFEAELMFFQNKSSFDNLKITLTDSENALISVTASLINGGDHTVLSVGGSSIRVNSGFGDFEKKYSLSYANESFKFGNASVQAETTDDGKAFFGFPSGKVNVKFTIEGAYSDSAIEICSINGQSVSSKSILDFVPPQIYISGNYGGSYAAGTEIILPRAFFADVLDPCSTCVLNVYTPDGEFLKDINGKELHDVDPNSEYIVRLSEVGTYSVQYLATDSVGNVSEPMSYALKAEDVIKPELSIIGEWKDGKVGEIYNFPKITVSDDSEAEIIVRIMIIDPNGSATVLDNDVRAVKFATSGIHTITIVAIDSYGNVSSVRVKVNVNG